MASRHSEVYNDSDGGKARFAIRHARWAIASAVLLMPIAIGSASNFLYSESSQIPVHQTTSGSLSPVINGSGGISIGGDTSGPNSVVRNPAQIWGGPNSVFNNPGQILGDVTHGPGPNNDLTITVTREQLKLIIQILQDAQRRLERHDASQNEVAPAVANSLSPGGAIADSATRLSSPPPASVAGEAALETQAAHPQGTSPTRLSGALPLLFAFVGATSLIVVLMVFAGLILVRAGAAAGGAKVDILGMKVDAKGTGIASIAFGAVVFIATFRPLIDAVVKISGD